MQHQQWVVNSQWVSEPADDTDGKSESFGPDEVRNMMQ